MPDSTRKVQVLASIFESGSVLVRKATSQAKIRITTVRMAVARFEFTCATPTFASTAVSPAKNAESNAQINQFMSVLSGQDYNGRSFLVSVWRGHSCPRELQPPQPEKASNKKMGRTECPTQMILAKS